MVTRSESSLLVLLAVIAGWIDALSFTALGKVFTSFQSGNLIFLGLAVDEGDSELLVALCGAYALSALTVGAIGNPEVTSLGPAVLLSLAIAGLLSRDRELRSIGSTGPRTLQAHPNLRRQRAMSDRRPPTTTTDSGAPVSSDEHSLTVGPNGPTVLHDAHLVQKMQHFNRERVPERVVHAKGSGAHGFFEVTEDVTQWTSAGFLSEVGKRTPMFARFSQVAGELGSADTVRDPRGLRAQVLHRRGQLRPRWQQHADVLRARRDQVRGLHPLAEAHARHRAAVERHAVGLLDAVARDRAPGDDPHVRPRHAARATAT